MTYTNAGLKYVLLKNFSMITWIQLVLQKHHKSVFSVLLVVIIIAFVFTIGQVPFLGDRNSAWDEHKDFYGFDLSNQAVVSQLQTCAFYEAILGGMQIQTQQQLTRMILRQAYLLSLAKDLNIRQVSEAELRDYVQKAPIFLNPDGTFSTQLWNNFKQERIGTGRISDESLTFIIAQNALVSKMSKLLGGPGYVFKSEVEREYNQSYGTWDFNLAILEYDDFKPEIKVDPAALENYFKANIENYRVGEGVVLETAFFPASKYASSVKAPSQEEIAAFYGANMRKYATQKDGKPFVPQLSDVSEKVKADILADAALRQAASAAEELAIAIYDSGAKMNSPEVRKIFSDAKVELKKSDVIRTTDKSAPKGIPENVAAAGLQLDENSFYTDPIPVSDGVWFVMLVQKVDSYLPKFADVKQQVEKDYLESQKQKLFAERGATLDAALAKAVAEGKSFADVAKASGAKVEAVKNFSLTKFSSTAPAVMNAYSVIRSELPKMKVGGVSKMQTLSKNGYIVNLVKFTKPSEPATAADYKKLAQNIEMAFSAFSSNTVVGDMIEKESGAAEAVE